MAKEELLDEIWGDRFVGESALTTRIKMARRSGSGLPSEDLSALLHEELARLS